MVESKCNIGERACGYDRKAAAITSAKVVDGFWGDEFLGASR